MTRRQLRLLIVGLAASLCVLVKAAVPLVVTPTAAAPFSITPNFVSSSLAGMGATPGVAVGDLNGDGLADVVTTAQVGNASVVRVRLGDGLGGFGAVASFTASVAPTFAAARVAIADMNGDGFQDLVVSGGTPSNGLTVLAGNGTGAFAPPVQIWNEAPLDFKIGDFNGDSFPDIVLATTTSVRLLLNVHDGAGHVTSAGSAGFNQGNANFVRLSVGDINLDGHLDVAAVTDTDSSSASRLELFGGTGNGGLFPMGVRVFQGGNGPPGSPSSGGCHVRDVAIADLNADAAPEIITVTNGGCAGENAGVWVFGNSAGTVATVPTGYLDGITDTALAIGDVNDDGFPDVVVTGSSGWTQYRLNTGDGTLSFGVYVGNTDQNPVLRMADLDGTGQGSLDLVVGGDNGDPILLLNTPNRAPVARAGTDHTVSATSAAGAMVTLDASASSDPDGDALTFEWRDESNVVVGTSASVSVPVAFGTHTFTVTAVDASGRPSSDSVAITVADTFSIAIATPLDGASIPAGTVVAAAYTCSDSASLLTSCTGTTVNGGNIDTSSVGAHTFTVTATNSLGHMSSQSVSYSVTIASTTTVVSCPASVNYTGAALTPCTVMVAGSDGSIQTPTPTYANNIAVGTATASYTFAGDANHTGSTGSTTFAIARAPITVSGVTASDKVYDGTTAATITITGATFTGVAPGETVSLNASGATAAFATASAGSSKTVTVSGLTLSGTHAGNYILSSGSTTATASILTKPVFVAVAFQNKTYDGTTVAMPGGCGLSGVLPADGPGMTCLGFTGTFDSPNAGLRNVNANTMISGAAVGNYTLGAAGTSVTTGTATVTATILTKPVTGTLTAAPKPYDKTTAIANGSVSCALNGVIAADSASVTCAASGGSFNGASVGAHTVSATMTLGGAAAGNYTLGAAGTAVTSAAGSASANITTRQVTAVISAIGKTYDGTSVEPDANMSCTVSGALSGDVVTCTATSGLFSGASVGATSVTATATLGGADAANYTLGAPGTSLSSMPAVIATSGASTADVVYGQLGSFTTNAANKGGPSADSLNQPYQVVSDATGGTYIVDSQNSRVLYFAAGSTTASRVYGQGGSFTSATANNGGVSANSLSFPSGAVLDASGNLYIADSGNNRVLFYLAGSTTATRIYGQGGNFATGTANSGGVSANSLSNPVSVAVDPTGNVFVADQANNRVLFYAGAGTTASRVYGQNGNFSGTFSGLAANFMNAPGNLVVDASGNLYVSDMNNNRVLYFSGTSTTATRVYGQSGNFTTNGSGTSATSLKFPRAAALDSNDNLYIADQQNNRVLFFPSGATTATRVYGQDGSFVTGTANNGGVGPLSLSNPIGAAVASDGTLVVSDLGNHRVLRYAATGPGAISAVRVTATLTAANKPYDATTVEPDANMSCTLAGVLPADAGSVTCTATNGSFSSATIGSKTVTATVTIDGAAAGNYTFGAPGTVTASTAATATASITQKTITAVVTAADKTYDRNTNATITGCTLVGVAATDSTTCVVSGAAADNQFNSASAGSKTVTAANLSMVNNPNGAYVLASTTGTTTATINRKPLTVQLTAANKVYDGTAIEPDASMSCAVTGVLSPDVVTCTASAGSFNGSAVGSTAVTATATLGGAQGANYTLGALGTSLASTSVVATAGVTASTTADAAYGQGGSFTTNTANKGGLSATSINQPYHLTTDAAGGLYIVDYNNSRVLYFPAGASTPTRVYGQGGSFTSSTSNLGGISATSLSFPDAAAVDAANNVYIADQGNNRVLFYAAGSTTATRVYGQGGSFTTNAQNYNGISADSLAGPAGVAVDATGVYIADSNSRVLFYAGTSTTATRVYGQGGNFTTQNSGISATTMTSPTNLAIDSGGNLYVSDSVSNRILFFPASSTTATRVYGQNGNFNINQQGTSSTLLKFPRVGGVDANDNLYVADQQNHRVLFFPAGMTTATRVYGQGGNFTTGTANNGGVSANSLFNPTAAMPSADGKLYISDLSNNRVLRFATSGSGSIISAPLVATLTAANKPYDGTATEPDANMTCTLAGVPPADAANVGCAASGGSFGSATIGSKTVTATIALTGPMAANYTLASTSGSATASITTAPLTVNLVAAGKAYDRTTTEPNGSLSCSLTGVIAAEAANVACAATSGSFDSANAGARTVTATVTISGSAVSNYTLGAAGTSTTTAPRTTASTISTLTVSGALAAVSKTYDGTATEPDANMTCALTGVLAGDTVTCTATNGLFSSASVGATSVTATATIGGAQGANYTFGSAGTAVSSTTLAAGVGAASTTAEAVYGQGGSFITNTANNGGLGANSINSPFNVAADAAGGVYIADFGNNRVLFYPVGSTTATRVYGQGGSFVTNGANQGGLSANSLSGPSAVAVDAAGNVYIVDNGNNRVLFYAGTSTTATRVYGQATFVTNGAGTSATAFSAPQEIAVDATGVYVADQGNNRVLFFAGTSTTATRVYGQGGNFNSAGSGVSATTFNAPGNVALDASGNLYVSDLVNNRVLFFLAGSTTATRVYGQNGSFTSNTANNGGISANSLRFPRVGGVDASDNLYIADQQNHRLLSYPSGATTATRVYGQGGSFTTANSNSGGLSANSLSSPLGATVSNGKLYVDDLSNNRVLRFALGSAATITASPITATLTVTNKVYDRTTAATNASLSCALTGVTAADAANVTCTATSGTFASLNVGSSTVTATVTISGSAAGNYTLGAAGTTTTSTSATATASITAAPLSVTSIVANDKAYDGTTTATINTASATLAGVFAGDTVTLSTVGATGTFATSSAGTGKTVSVSGLTIAGASAGNYSLASGNATATASILTKPMTLSLGAFDKTYDGTNAASGFACGLTGVLAVDAGNVTCTSTNGTYDSANVGNRTVTATQSIGGPAAGNYTLGAAGTNVTSTLSTATAAIKTKSVTAALTGAGKTYDGTASAAGATCALTGIIAGDSGATTCTVSSGTFDGIAAGAHTVTGTMTIGGAAGGNYTLGAVGTTVTSTSGTASGTILTKPITVSLGAQNKTYDGTTSASGFACGITGVLPVDAANVTCTGSNGSFDSPNAGPRTVTATQTIGGSAIGNYTLGAAGTSVLSTLSTTTATIRTKALTVALTAIDKPYDGTVTATGLSCAFSGVLALDLAAVNCAASNGTFASANIGTQTVTATTTIAGTAAGNYTLGVDGTTTSSASATATAAISAGTISITGLAANDKTYDGTTVATINAAGATLTGKVSGDAVTLDLSGATATFATAGAGAEKTVTITGLALSGSAAGNYVLASTSATTTANILTKPMIVSVGFQNKTYDGTTVASPGGCSTTGVLPADGPSVTCAGFTGTFDSPNAGLRNVNANTLISGPASGNYTLGAAGTSVTTGTATVTATIRTKAVTATLTATDKPYDGTTAALGVSCTLSGVLAADTANATCVASNGTFASANIGTHAVTATETLSGSAAANYTLGIDGSLTTSASATTTAAISAGTITVTGLVANDKTYDGTTTATINAAGATLTGKVVGDAVTLDLAGASSTFATASAGVEKTVTITGLALSGSAAGNYVLASTSATTTATILTKPMIVSVAFQNKTYDGTTVASPGGCSTTGVLPADGLSVTCQGFTGAFDSPNAGLRNVNANTLISGPASGNYTLGAAGTSVTTGTATVTAAIRTKAVTATLTATDKAYDGTTAAPGVSCTLAGVLAADTANATCVASNGTFDSANPGARTVTATETLSGSAAGNYTLGAVGTTVTSTTGTASASITGGPSVTTITCPASVVFTGAALTPCMAVATSNDGLNQALTVTYTNNVNAGTATATASFAGDAGHTPSSDSVTFAITTAASITSLTCPASTAFTGSALTPCTATVSGAGGLATTATVSYTNNTNAGTASATASYGGDANHQPSSDSTTFAIGRATVSAVLTALGKGYDRTTAEANASLSCGITGAAAGDAANLTCTAANGAFDIASAGARVVTANVTMGGTAAGNYTLGAAGTAVTSGTATASSSITTRAITVTLTALGKSYDGTATEPDANMSCTTSGVLAGDGVTCTATNGAFSGVSVGSGAVTATVTIGGAEAGNYTLGAAGTAVNSASTTATLGGGSPSTTAEAVYGQNGSFTTNTLNNGGVSATSIGWPHRVVADPSGGIYVAQEQNHRVVYFPNGSMTASIVWGQGGSFTTNTENKGGLSASSLSYPRAAVPDANGNLYITDSNNNRVLFFPAGSQTATRVYGQGGSFTSNVANLGGISANSLNNPNGVAFDASGNVYIADSVNHRVLVYAGTSTTATGVYGQAGFTTATPSNSATGLNFPQHIAFDSLGNLYVSDQENNRVQMFAPGSTTATRTYSGLKLPRVGGFDANDNLYIADAQNHRVLFYPAGSTTATRVYGQGGSFSTATCNKGGVSADSLCNPLSAAVTTDGKLYIADQNNNRLLRYSLNGSGTIARAPLTAVLTAADKVFDGTPTAPNASLTCTITGVAPADEGLVTCTATNGNFNNPAVGSRTVTATLTIGGAAVGNYTLGAAGTAVTSKSATASAAITIAPTVTTVTCPASVPFTGTPRTPCSATITGPAGLNGSITVTYSNNTASGTATATASYPGDANRAASTDTKTFTITGGASVTSITCPSSVVFTGAAQTPCTATVTGVGGLNTTTTVIYTNNIHAGTATASASFAGDASHTSSNATTTFTIAPAASTTSISCTASVVFTGAVVTPCTATVTATDGLSTTTPVAYTNNTNAGTATATASFAGDADHAASSDTVTFTITVASSLTTITCQAAEFTGQPRTPCAVSVTGVGGLTTTAPVVYTNNANAGTATATATFDGDANHAPSSATTTFAITVAPSLTTITCQAAEFTGQPRTPCVVSVTGIGGLATTAPIVYTNNTSVGTATATATFDGDANHAPSTATTTFAITSASSITSISCTGTVVFTGAAQTPCTATVTGIGGLNTTATVTYTANTNAGTATATASFAGDADHAPSTATTTFTIAPAASVTTIACADAVYSSVALTPCTATVTGVGGLSTTTSVTYASNTSAGTATATANFAGDANHSASSDTKTFTIAPASSTTVVSCPATVPVTASAITPCTATATGVGGLNQTLLVTYANNIAVGTATAAATFAGDSNHTASTGSATFTIALGAPGVLDGNGQIASLPANPTVLLKFDFSAAQLTGGASGGSLTFWTTEANGRVRPDNSFDSTAITALVFADDPRFTSGGTGPAIDTVTIRGTGRWEGVDGYTFLARATDQGEPGTGLDTFALTIFDSFGVEVFNVGGLLTSGNVASNRLPGRNSAPMILGAPSDQIVEATSPAGAVVTYSSVTAVDNQGVTVPVVCDPASGSVVPLGRTRATCTATDARGLTRTIGFTIRVVDLTAPTITSTPANITVEADRASGAKVTFTLPTATDAVDTTVTVKCTPASGSVFDLGTTTVTCTAKDNSGNVATTSFTVTVNDTAAPVFTNPPADRTVSATGPTGAVETYPTPRAVDEVDGAVAVSCSPASGSTFPLGTTPVTCAATDSRGHSSSITFNVIVVDTVNPVIGAVTSLKVEATGPDGAVVTYALPTVTDIVDPNPAITCAPASGSTFPIGARTVTCTAIDASGNVATRSFSVTVTDKTAPAIIGAADRTIEATSAAGAVVPFSPIAMDLVAGPVPVNCGPLPAGMRFPLGNTKVTCTALDSYGNQAKTVTTITVVDRTPPVMNIPSLTLEATSAAGVTMTWPLGSATDLVDPLPQLTCPGIGVTFPLGVTTVTCTATDRSGNVASQLVTVTVLDRTAPRWTTFVPGITLTATSPSGAFANFNQPKATDAVSTPFVSCDHLANVIFPVGSTTVTCTAADAAGNVATQIFIVNVFWPAGAPTIVVPALTTTVREATSPAGASVTLGVTAYDATNTAIAVTCSRPSGFFPIGLTDVTCTATDVVGRVSTKTFTVTVRDTVKPTVTITMPLPNQTFALNQGVAAGFTCADAASGIATCVATQGATQVLPGQWKLDTSSLGNKTLTVVATDVSGNVQTVSVNYKVR